MSPVKIQIARRFVPDQLFSTSLCLCLLMIIFTFSQPSSWLVSALCSLGSIELDERCNAMSAIAYFKEALSYHPTSKTTIHHIASAHMCHGIGTCCRNKRLMSVKRHSLHPTISIRFVDCIASSARLFSPSQRRCRQ